ncbi:MAG: peptidyl-prolyl cis-trans isomerase [Flammeovirgaceae bacterium]
MNRLLVLLIFIVLCGCDYLQSLREKNEAKNQVPVARVYDKTLYQKDLKGLVPYHTSPEDSANMVNRYVDQWAKKQLMLTVAEKNTDLDEAEVTKRVEDYKYDLLVYAYEKKYIEEHLDTVVTAEQINDYYLANKDNFELRQNIVKGLFVRIPNDARKVKAVKRWMSRTPVQKSLDDIREYAYQFGGSHHLVDSVWIDFEDLIADTPFIEELTNRIQAVKSKQLLETSDSLHTYYLRVLEYKLTSEISPLSFVVEQIRDLIINKRKIELRRKHEKEIMSEAKKNQEYEIYKKD